MIMTRFAIFVVVGFLYLNEAVGYTNLCDSTNYWTHYGNHCFKTYNKKLTWEDASNVCRLYDAELPIVTDKNMQDAVANISNSVQADLWTGILLHQGVWVNSRYEQVNHSNHHWAYEATKSPNNDSCVVVGEQEGNTTWIIKDCKSTQFFACSKPEGTCPPGCIFHQRSCYRYINTLQTSWNHSSEYCHLLDSTLIEITDLDRQIFLQNFVQSQQASIENDDRIWLNLQKDSNNQWFWGSNGTKPMFTNWFNDTDLSEFDCAYIDVGREGKWYTDVPCTSSVSTACFFDVGSSNWRKNMITKPEGNPSSYSECGIGWTDNPLGNTCYLVNKEIVTWIAAERICVSMGAHLISLNNVQEQGYVSGFLQSSKNEYYTLWIGANSRADGKGFGWTDESPFVFYNWFPGQPDGQIFASEECVAMFSSNGKWTDVSCDQRHPFVCEKICPSKVKTATTPHIDEDSGSICQDGWKSFGNHCYLIERQKLSWMKASQYCRERKGVLASVKDQNEQNFLFSQLPSDYCFNIHPNDTYCMEMAASEKCSDDVQYMLKQCPAACGQCNKNCSDVYNTESCQAWASNNGCETNPQWMFQKCKKSCGACDALFQGGFWLGLRDEKDQTFVWENGDDVSFSFWRKSEPQGFTPNHEGCTAMAYDNGLWFDRDCETVMPGLICQAPKIQNGVTSSPGCSGKYISYESMCYSFVDEETSWSDAQIKCESENGNLATVHNRYIQAFLSSQFLGKTGNFWIGYRETYLNNTMKIWNSGHQVDFLFGDVIDSSSLGMTEACAAMKTTVPVGIWSFLNCSATQKYICEKLREGYTTTMIPSSTSPPLLCPDSWIPLDGFCFKVFVNHTSWLNARAYCRGIGSNLASIHSEEESKKLRNHADLPRDGEYWIGLSEREKEGNWLWSDGTLFDFKPWMPGEPNNWNSVEHCARYRASDRKFSDIHCSFKLPFICKVQKGVPVNERVQPKGFEKCTDERFVRFNGSCFSIMLKQTTFYEARRLCRQMDAEIASIHNRDENTFLADIATESSWIGIQKSPSTGFHWIDGSPLDFTSWSLNEPNNFLNMERCAATQNELWNDYNCGKVLGGVICKKRQSSGPYTESPPLIKGGCPPQFKPSLYNNKCYKMVNTPSNWTAAKTDCEKTKGGSLLSVKDQVEQDFILSLLIKSTQYMWIGLRKLQNQFLWENNKEVTYTNWMNGEPNSGVGIECTEIQGQFDLNVGTWKTAPCTYLRPYICEAPKDTSFPEIPSSVCPQNYTQNDGSCYRFFNDFPLDWESADHYCSLQNGTLATISTIFRFGFIQAIGLKYEMKTYWIGLKKSNTSDLYKWRNGLPYIYTHWDQSEPKEKSGQDCVLSHNNKWKETSCNIRLPFLCELMIRKPFLPPLSISCPASAMAFNGACYYIEFKHAGTWTEARNMCQQHGMDVVSIHSDIEIEHIREFAVRKGATTALWVGLTRKRLQTDPIGKVEFYWSDKSQVDYTNWNLNQPSDSLFSRLEECVEMFTDGTWNDVSCENIRGFICKDSVSNRGITTTVVYDIGNSTDDNITLSSENTTQSFNEKMPVKTQLVSEKTENPRVVFAIIGIVVGLLLLLFVIGTVAYFFKSRNILPMKQEPNLETGFENAMYCKDEENVNITEI